MSTGSAPPSSPDGRGREPVATTTASNASAARDAAVARVESRTSTPRRSASEARCSTISSSSRRDAIRPAAAEHPLLAAALAEIEELVLAPEETARYLVTRIALAVQAALLTEHAPNVVADAFVASRLGSGWGPGYGTLRGVDFQAIIDFARLA